MKPMDLTEIMGSPEVARMERAKIISALFRHWRANITVSIWGRGKATITDKGKCADQRLTGGAAYRGDCDNCQYFMGCRFDHDRQYFWGDHVDACCALMLSRDQGNVAEAETISKEEL